MHISLLRKISTKHYELQFKKKWANEKGFNYICPFSFFPEDCSFLVCSSGICEWIRKSAGLHYTGGPDSRAFQICQIRNHTNSLLTQLTVLSYSCKYNYYDHTFHSFILWPKISLITKHSTKFPIVLTKMFAWTHSHSDKHIISSYEIPCIVEYLENWMGFNVSELYHIDPPL